MARKELSLREIQLLELNILNDVIELFSKENLDYMLCGGTMLGCIRHQGFIPWDDDIDLFMPRDSYDKLLNMIRKGKTKIDNLLFLCPGDKNHYYPFIKVCDIRTNVEEVSYKPKIKSYVWIDIFPLDHYPDSELLHLLSYKFQRLIRYILDSGVYEPEYLSKKIRSLKPLYYVMGYSRVSKLGDNVSRLNNKIFSKSNHLGNGTWPVSMNDYFSIDMVSPLIRKNFEGYSFNVPKNFDGYLSRVYGNYMELPPVEKREIHISKAYIDE